MYLSCADYTFNALPHALVLKIIKTLGFDAVDIGFFHGHGHVRPDVVGNDVAGWATAVRLSCEQAELRVADVFAQSADWEVLAANNPDSHQQMLAVDFVRRCAEFASAVGSPGLTVLPGVCFGTEPIEAATERAIRGLGTWVQAATDAGVALSFEGHIGSIADTPTRAAALVDAVPGLQLTLDPGHFVHGGADAADIEALAGRARHVQFRSARPDSLQVRLQESTIDFKRFVAVLMEVGYTGAIATEYVCSPWQGCDRVDTLAETAALRAVIAGALTAPQN